MIVCTTTLDVMTVVQVNTWYPFSPCTQSPGNLLLQDFSQRIVGHFQLADHQPPTSGPFIITFIARRPKSSYGGRAMSVDQESEIVDIINDMPPIDGNYGIPDRNDAIQ